MGNMWQRLRSSYRSRNKEVQILMFGLDAAGRTTALYRLKLGFLVTTVPTIGYNLESLDYKNVRFVITDVSGCDKMRPLWKHYLQSPQVIIFFVDSYDHERMSESKDEFWKLLEILPKNVIVLVMANKQDLPSAMSVAEVSQKLEVEKMGDRIIHVQGSCATSGDGLYEGLSWIRTTLAHGTMKKSTQ